MEKNLCLLPGTGYPHRSQTHGPYSHSPHTTSADTGDPPTSMCACLAVPGRAHGYGLCSSSLPPTSILSRRLVPSAPRSISSCPPSTATPQRLQSQALSAAVDTTAGSSWSGAGSHLGLTPPYLPTETSRKAGGCVQRHQVFAQRQINTTPQALNWSLQL